MNSFYLLTRRGEKMNDRHVQINDRWFQTCNLHFSWQSILKMAFCQTFDGAFVWGRQDEERFKSKQNEGRTTNHFVLKRHILCALGMYSKFIYFWPSHKRFFFWNFACLYQSVMRFSLNMINMVGVLVKKPCYPCYGHFPAGEHTNTVNYSMMSHY